MYPFQMQRAWKVKTHWERVGWNRSKITIKNKRDKKERDEKNPMILSRPFNNFVAHTFFWRWRSLNLRSLEIRSMGWPLSLPITKRDNFGK